MGKIVKLFKLKFIRLFKGRKVWIKMISVVVTSFGKGK